MTGGLYRSIIRAKGAFYTSSKQLQMQTGYKYKTYHDTRSHDPTMQDALSTWVELFKRLQMSITGNEL